MLSDYFYDGNGYMVSYLYLGNDTKLYDEDEVHYNEISHLCYESTDEANKFLKKLGLSKYTNFNR